jgi:hypothetical protein
MTMTVKDLIKKLQRYDQNMTVKVGTYDLSVIEGVEIISEVESVDDGYNSVIIFGKPHFPE